MSPPIKRKLILKSTDQEFYKCKTDKGDKLIEPIFEMASTSMRKEEITIAKRLEIIQKLEKGAAINDLATEYGLHKRTIQRYKKNIESIRKFSKNPRCLVMKRNRPPLHEDTNTRLLEWILERQAKGDVFNDSLLQEKAKELHKKFGGAANFTASRGWLWRFKKRHNINTSGIQEKKAEINVITTEKLTKILSDEHINKENIYNIHETTVMWRFPHYIPDIPETISSNEEIPVENGRIKKDYVTIGFCTNATGTHKLPLLFVNKYTTSQVLKHCRHALSVVYTSQNNDCIDKIVFNDWYANHFKPSVRRHQQQKNCVGTVLLLVENFKGDISFEKVQDSHFKLIILPSDTSSITQPMDEDIITNYKKLFRQKLLHRIHHCDSGVRKFYANYNIKDCIDLISEAWDEITVTDIIYSWKKLLGQQDSEIVIKEEQEQFEENIAPEKVMEWISKCEKDEEQSTIEVIVKKEEINIEEEISTTDKTNIDHCSIEKKEIDRMFHNLEIWAKSQPEFIKLYAKILIHYHNQQ